MNFSNSDKKKLGALIGLVVVVGIVLILALQLFRKKDTKELVDQGEKVSSSSLMSDEEGQEESSSITTGLVSTEESRQTGESSLQETDSSSSTSSELSGTAPIGEIIAVHPNDPQEPKAKEVTVRAGSSKTASKSEKKPEESASQAESQPRESGKSSSTAPASSSSKEASSSTGDPSSEELPKDSTAASSSSKSQEPVPDKNGIVDVTEENTVLGKLNRIPTYFRQVVGNAPVDFYDHPKLPLSLDFRNDKDLSQVYYVQPTSRGFLVFNRSLMNLYGIDPDHITEYLKDHQIPGAVSVEIVDEKSKEELEKNSKLNVIFSEYNGQILAFFQDKKSAEEVNRVLSAFSERAASPDWIQSNLTDSGLVGVLEKAKPEPLGEVWGMLKDLLKKNPAALEWRLNLPLYAKSEAYLKEGKDLRAHKPDADPTYATGVCDLDGDGNVEYLIHAKATSKEDSNVSGYWAILTATDRGPVVSQILSQGSGDLLQNDQGLLVSSSKKEEGKESIRLEEAAVADDPRVKSESKELSYLQPKGLLETLTGEELAKKYPGTMLVPHGKEWGLVSLKDYDTFMDWARGRFQNATLFQLQEANDKETGDKEDVKRVPVKDFVEYLKTTFPDFPVSPEDFEKGRKIEEFKNLKEPLTLEMINKQNR